MRKLLTAAAAAAALLGSAIAAQATIINGAYSVSTDNGATITNLLADPFSLDLTLNVGQTFNLANVLEHDGGTSTATAAFNFTAPSALNSSLTGADIFSITGAARHDSLTWANSGLLIANFADGSALNVLLGNGTFNGAARNYAGLDVPVTFTLTKEATTAVPEPFTLSIFGAGIAGMAALRRRKRLTS